jgi:hypothetical protein
MYARRVIGHLPKRMKPPEANAAHNGMNPYPEALSRGVPHRQALGRAHRTKRINVRTLLGQDDINMIFFKGLHWRRYDHHQVADEEAPTLQTTVAA